MLYRLLTLLLLFSAGVQAQPVDTPGGRGNTNIIDSILDKSNIDNNNKEIVKDKFANINQENRKINNDNSDLVQRNKSLEDTLNKTKTDHADILRKTNESHNDVISKLIQSHNYTTASFLKSIRDKDDIIVSLNKTINQFSLVDLNVRIEKDHDKFVIGGPFKIGLEIVNNSSATISINPNDVQLVVPNEVIPFPHYNDNYKSGNSKHVIKSPDTEITFPPDNFTQPIILSPRSSYTIVWDRTFDTIGSMYSILNQILFRSDYYRFPINIKMNMIDTSGPSATTGTAQSPTAPLPQFQVTKEAKIQVDLGSMFIALSSIIGGLITVAVYQGFARIKLYKDYYHDYRYRLEREITIHRKETVIFFIISLILPPVVVAMAAQGAKVGVYIKVMDFSGAVAAGFLVQLLAVQLKHAYMGKFAD